MKKALTIILVIIVIIMGLEVNKTLLSWQNNQTMEQSVEQAIKNK
jgi:uncharacterized protein YpmB